jgi:hypothetical protein
MTFEQGRQGQEVDIAPDVGVLGIFKFLDYEPWFAIAEFVDNALDSYLRNKEKLLAANTSRIPLRVDVVLDHLDEGRLVITDDAAGISETEWKRALRPAEPPPEDAVLSEFGMGMKTAACWFGKRLTVQSTALGDPVVRIAYLDYDDIIANRTTTVHLTERPALAEEHGTVVIVDGLHETPRGRTVSKIKDHLSSIYRLYTANDELMLTFKSASGQSEVMKYEPVEVLDAQAWNDPEGAAKVWDKPVLVELDSGKFVTGRAALRKEGSTSHAGFALFRNRRLITGSDDTTYRPREIFGASTTYIYQRLFGELEFHGFSVTHTKDAFRWGEGEEAEFLRKLKVKLDEDPIVLLTQGRKYRAQITRRKEVEISEEAAVAAKETAAAISVGLPGSNSTSAAPTIEPPPTQLTQGSESYTESVSFSISGQLWEVVVEVSNDLAHGLNWIDIADRSRLNAGVSKRQMQLRLSLKHPFVQNYVGVEYENLDLLMRLGASLVLAEVFSRQSGIEGAPDVRRRVNELLRDVFTDSKNG